MCPLRAGQPQLPTQTPRSQTGLIMKVFYFAHTHRKCPGKHMGKKNPASKNPNRFFPSKDNSLDVMSIFANNRSTQWSIPSPYKPLNTCMWRCLQPPPCGGLVAESCPALATPWTVARQAPLSMGFSRQEYWTGLPCPPPGDLPDPKIPRSPALQADSLLSEPPGANLQSILPQNKWL